MIKRYIFTVLACLLSTVPAVADNAWQRVEAVTQALGDAVPHRQGLVLGLPLVTDNGGEIPLELSFTGTLAADERLTELRVIAPRNPKPDVIAFYLHSPRALPELHTRIRLSESQTVYALAKSNQGNTWLAQHEIRVANSGCLMTDTAADTEIAMSNPRVALPRNAKAGSAGQFRTLINHPMETGIRTDGRQAPPQNLVESLTVSNAQGPLFSTRFYTGTAANPYVLFTLEIAETTEGLRFEWQDQSDNSVREERNLRL